MYAASFTKTSSENWCGLSAARSFVAKKTAGFGFDCHRRDMTRLCFRYEMVVGVGGPY
jgi:hypothetical protein